MQKVRSFLVTLLLVFFFFSVNISESFAQTGDEYNGRLPGWVDVKKRFNAKGNGIADDTKALQTAIDSLTCRPVKFNTGDLSYTVIYLPAGRYKITKTLVMKGKIGVEIIGEDPENTIIEWAGGKDSIMFLGNGSAYYKLSRITWDAKNIRNVECIGIHWREKWNTPESRSFAALNIEISDMVFKGRPKFGISGGTLRGKPGEGTGHNDSEITIKRCVFDSCYEAGIRISGYNALEYWIWDSKFLNCKIGVHCSLGNYHLYRSYFKNSVVSDILNRNGYYNSVRFCYSENSGAFSVDEGSSSNPFKRTFQGNTVLNTKKMPIQYYHVGRLTLFDNIISNSRDTINPFLVNQKGWAPVSYQTLSIGNSYGDTKEPLRIANKEKKLFSINDNVLKKGSLRRVSFTSQMPDVPSKVLRKVFEVKPGSNSATIQEIINKASKEKGTRPIVYFRCGEYFIDKTITIPPGADLQIVGDGMRYSTNLIPARDLTCVFIVFGPTYISIKNIQIGTAGKKKFKAIDFRSIDQKEAIVMMDQIYSNADTTLFINKLNHVYFEKNNSFFSYGNIVHGGDLQRKGRGSLKLHCFGGQYAGVEVKNNASFVAKDCWWEGPIKVPLLLSGEGNITIDGAKIAPSPFDSLPIIEIKKFKGNISLMNMYAQGGISIESNNPDLNFLYWNAHIYYKKDVLATIPKKFQGKLMYAGLTNQCFVLEDPYCKTIKSIENKTVNVESENEFINTMTQQNRNAIPIKFVKSSDGSSNIFISRVLFDSFNIALQFNPEPYSINWLFMK